VFFYLPVCQFSIGFVQECFEYFCLFWCQHSLPFLWYEYTYFKVLFKFFVFFLLSKFYMLQNSTFYLIFSYFVDFLSAFVVFFGCLLLQKEVFVVTKRVFYLSYTEKSST
jgi:hypothetical protein